jgi:hypothetical protein
VDLLGELGDNAPPEPETEPEDVELTEPAGYVAPVEGSDLTGVKQFLTLRCTRRNYY